MGGGQRIFGGFVTARGLTVLRKWAGFERFAAHLVTDLGSFGGAFERLLGFGMEVGMLCFARRVLPWRWFVWRFTWAPDLRP
jgi:hypothetical protein